MLTFDERRHEYQLDGRILPSVTQILRATGLVDSAWYDPASADRGTKAHSATQYWDEGDLDDEALADELRPYVSAWADFRAAFGHSLDEIELRVANAAYGFAGTIDRVFATSPLRTICDIKTGGFEPWHAVQTAAYGMALGEPVKRIGVYLGADGKYTVRTFTGSEDADVFRAALAVFNWKARHK